MTKDSLCTDAPRMLNLDSVPKRMAIKNLELDMTCDCNLRCVYCYKRLHHKVYLSKQTAFDAMVWFLKASSDIKEINVYCMGGEPLLQYELLKTLVPFTTRRAFQQGKSVSFSVTTNSTLVNKNVIEFFKKWNIGFHTSVDGIPAVQDNNRPTQNGGQTSSIISKTIPMILEYSPATCARATVLPANVDLMFDSYLYFRTLGYKSIVMVPGEPLLWDDSSLLKYEKSIRKIAEYWKKEIQNGVNIWCHTFTPSFKS
ncbi:MAG: 4Fe-4S cluster-binding domain-containing protein [Planctomycetaceae bacterium]|jgi:uncharacterized protein|nr:4Fe-4S cluster-binding domain-containing protein [Planctomycetaceae bacterium]